MFKKTLGAAALIVAMMAAGGTAKAAQESNTPKGTSASEKAVNPYRIDFSVNEMEDGKKINTRQYSMNLNAEESNEIKIGTRVPVDTNTKQGEFQYIDVGTSIWCRLEERPNGLSIAVRAEISNFAMPDQARPIIRQLSIKASTLAQLGKPMVVGSVDDPNSKRTFQLEVTVTKLK
ncbi:MAG: hypothetical protein WBW31_04335 [Candidatus Sulfotelmatobacter sp.]|jgi:hypothetical protein